MPELAYVNGKISSIEMAMVPVEDRGYQFGDAVYEVIVSYSGRLFALEEHLERLEGSMCELDFPPISRETVRHSIQDLFKQADLPRAALYLQISRGVGPRNHAFPETRKLQVVMTVRKVDEKPAMLRREGTAAITLKDFRWGRCDIKTVQLLANVLAKQKATESGVDDAIFVAEDEVVREATSSNVFIVADGVVITHPLTQNILPGITRAVVIDLCKDVNLALEERFYYLKDLYSADEVFMTGTITEVLPLVKIDGQIIGDGKVGPVSKQLYGALHEKINNS
jgi:D-alanine transaminase